MSNLEIVRRWYATRDSSLLSEGIRWAVLETFPEGGEYRGRSAVLESFFPKLSARFESFGAEPARFIAEGDSVVVLGSYRAKGRNGAVATSAFAHVWTLAEGKIAAFDQVADTAALAPAWRVADAPPAVRP